MRTFKSKILSVIFGKAEKPEEHAEAAQAPMDEVDNHVTEMEAENARLTEANAALNTQVQQLTEQVNNSTAQVTTLTASVAELTAQLTTITAERDALQASVASLQADLAKKPTGQLTTVVANPEKEEAIAGDKTETPKSYRTKVDDEADKYLAAFTPNLK